MPPVPEADAETRAESTAAKPARSAAAPARSTPAQPGFLERGLGLVVAALPFGVALSRAAGAGQWRDDLPAVRDLGLVSVGVGGGLSTVAAQALSLVPLGSRTFRASAGSAIALGLAAWLVYQLALRVLRAAMPPGAPAASRLGALLAAIAALTASMSPAWQLEGTVGGGAMWATCAALGAVTIALSCAEAARGGVRAWVWLGVLCGAAFAESPAAGLCSAAAAAVALVVPRLQAGFLDRADRIVARLLLRRWETAGADARTGATAQAPAAGSRNEARADARAGVTAQAPAASSARDARTGAHASLPDGRAIVAIVGAAIVTAALLLAPVVLRPLAPRAWADLGRFLSAASVAAPDTPAAETSALSAWGREIGFLSLLIALGGAVLALLRPRTRAPIAALLALVALDTLLPARLAAFLTADPLAPLRCMAIAALAVGSAFGVHEITLLLRRAKVPLARPAGVLVVMFHVTLIALTSEEAQVASDRDGQVAAEVWTDEAFGALPSRSAVLVRSPAIAWRLWAARTVRGERPDVLVIPAPLLGRGRLTEALLSNERATALLLRDMALTGSPSEHALSTLADARPLFVELFPGWPQRLFRHLSVSGLWLGYAPEPRGPSDRKLTLFAGTAPLERVLRAVGDAKDVDPSTAAVAAESLKGQAALLIALGEAETAQAFLMKVAELTPKKSAVSAGPVRAQLAPASPDKRAR